MNEISTATFPFEPRFVVGLGASAGGLEALERFFDAAPDDCGAAFVVVMHLARDFRSVLDELLARHTRMPVCPVADGLVLAPNTVYVIQPGTEIELEGNTFRVVARPLTTPTGRVSSIDIFLRSLASAWRQRAAAVILSGSGSDGAQGVTFIRDSGGFVFAQSPETSKFDSMPIAAIAACRVTAVDAPDALAQLVLETMSLAEDLGTPPDAMTNATALRQILAAVVGTSHLDASQYTQSTFERRVQRRMQELNETSLIDYAQRVHSDRNEARTLSEMLLIGVTDFFRDAAAFAVIERQVVPELIRRSHAEGRPIRIWVAGCASGEEAYSLAMLLAESAADSPAPVEFQIFATDVHKGLLAEAARGEYLAERMQSVSDSRRRAFFKRTTSGGWQVDVALRKNIVFAPHDVLVDPPFTRLDLVVCRNLLIYFSIDAQQRVLGSFSFGLLERGFLFLGTSETVGAHRDSFEFVDARRRVFRRTQARARGQMVQRMVDEGRLTLMPAVSHRKSAKAREAILMPAYAALLKEYAPPSLLVNQDRDLLHTFGDARQYLRTPDGVVRSDVSDMVDVALRTPIAAGVERALRERAPITFARIALHGHPEKGRIVDVTIRPLPIDNGDTPYLLVIIRQPDVVPLSVVQATPETPDQSVDPRIVDLEIELLRTREALQATIEEIETANEELQATNEELMSSNEELQSTNEELSSLNEELHSVNAEHFRQNNELVRLTRDFDALLHATEIGVLFFDEDMSIRRFTRLVGELFSFAETDVGRPLSTFRSPFVDLDTMDLVHRVIRTGSVEEVEAHDVKGRAWLLRAASYPDRKGVVLSIISINRLREQETPQARLRDQWLARAAPFAGDPVVVVAPDTGRVEFANSAALIRMGLSEGREATAIQASRLTPEWGDRTWTGWLSSIPVGADDTRLDVPVFDRDGGIFVADLRAVVVSDGDSRRAVVRVVENRDRAEALRELQERSRMFALSNRELEQFATVVAHDLRAPLRHLNQFAGFVAADLGPSASDEVKEYLEIIQSSAANMTGMIERLLDYARIGAGAPDFQVVDLGECVDQAALHLRNELQSAGASLSRGDLPRIHGDRILLIRLFQNLLSNAVKYRQPGKPVAVEIAAAPDKDDVRITVTDNGIGIDPAYADEIFKMFSRLHTDTEYSGHGLGLTICRRVCEIHGGTIELDRDWRDGARFVITLPKPVTRTAQP